VAALPAVLRVAPSPRAGRQVAVDCRIRPGVRLHLPMTAPCARRSAPPPSAP
jgi:hypothetical protein